VLIRKLVVSFGAVVVLVLVGLTSLAIQRVGGPPSVGIETGLPAIGRNTPVRILVEEPGRGLSSILIELVQEGQAVQLAHEQHAPQPFWAFWGPRVNRREIEVAVGKDHQIGSKKARRRSK
jgi:hypothetical protein